VGLLAWTVSGTVHADAVSLPFDLSNVGESIDSSVADAWI
jgi:hypothetical protein